MKHITIVLAFHCLGFFAVKESKATPENTLLISHLKTEYTACPLGMDVAHPRFSWQMESVARDCRQTAYLLRVRDESGKEVWTSRKVNSSTSLNIRYAGAPLKPRTRYQWTVVVWDQKGGEQTAGSWFETGLMETGQLYSAWNKARWIGSPDSAAVCYSPYLPVFTLQYVLQLDAATAATHAGFIYGANDQRLMDSNKNFKQLQSLKDSSYIMIELDIAPLQQNSTARLNVYRSGYAKKDTGARPLLSMAISGTIINNSNRYAKHTFRLTSVLGDTRIYIDGMDKPIGAVNLNPLGNGGDFIAYPVVGELGLFVPKGQTAFFSAIEIRNYRSPSGMLFSDDIHTTQTGERLFADAQHIDTREATYKVKAGEKDFMICALPQGNGGPMLRTVFTTPGRPLSKARLYVSARGVYDFYMNGKRIGDDYFNPGLTQYNKTQLYQTFDVTKEINSGKNAMGAVLGEGWWSGGATYAGENWNYFGDKQSLLAQLVLTYADGKEEVIVTNPESWMYYGKGPVRYGSFFQGEVYDAAREQAIGQWSAADYTATGWQKAAAVSLEQHTSKVKSTNGFPMPVTDDYKALRLIGQYGPTVKKVKELTAVAVESVRPGVYVYDMGQNMAGVPCIALEGMQPGSRITLRFAEVKYPQLPEYKTNEGMLMLENIRAAMAQDIYITRGGSELIQPRFTYHGYRYVEITGLAAPLPLKAVKGDVLSSVHGFASKYETSSAAVNQLWQNITWSTLANFMSVPTDCPQRNERLGWSGDISVFSRTATYLADLPQFVRRHMQAMRDLQSSEGRFSDVAPVGGGFGGVLWGSAGITVAWESYKQYGDADMLAEHYDAMKNYIQYLVNNIDPQSSVLFDKDRTKWASLGDWLSPEYDRTEKSLLWEVYFLYDLQVMERMAGVLQKTADSQWLQKLYKERKAFFNRTYVDGATGKTVFRDKTIDTQASYAIPLQFNVFDEAIVQKAAANLAVAVTRENKADDGTVCPPYSLMTGFIGTAWINSALSGAGYSDIAYRLLQQTTYPSWLYPVTQGATTIWERLNSYTHTNGFGGNNRMNSFNHYSFGAVGAWMYEYSLGIQRGETGAAFSHFVLRPEPDATGAMSYAKGHYDAPYGRIESSWQKTGTGYQYRFVIPANTTATLYLKARSAASISENGKPLQQAKGVQLQGMQNGKACFTLRSGVYTIQVN